MDLRIQNAVVANLRTRPDAVQAGPFVLGLDHGTDSPHINYATPLPGAAITSDDVADLVTAFGGRPPRLEYVTSCAPDLEKLLLDAGFAVEARNEYLVCTPSSLATPPVPDGFRVFAPVTDDDLTGMIAAQNQAFGGPASATPDDVARYRRNQDHGAVQITAQAADGRYAGGGTSTAPSDGVSEVAGIAVGEPFRRAGLGGAITAAITSRLFAAGVDLAWLEASGEDSWRVYERVGYRAAGKRLYIAKY
ncbi:GNAT family N-acetyltransferase [Actinoplanes awajinensis]|uniref:Acetyltransferase n=1 Tax=Actinoplanes awajinensis subsp. mycoplanecinus TaxID=135947 RepID=A0A101JN48_9ACTN|nr:GNAT family N-acetyltransferase [Actinoplanes awajinensis]KUL29854.1 acetyltransferase [Actinoplanes awajinensis subsp. mycoplanecinus]